MPEKNLIGIDFDDVLFDFNTPLARYHNRMHGTKYGRKDIVSFFLKQLWKCSSEEVIIRLSEFYRSEDHLNLLPLEGAVEAIDRLSLEYDFAVITARPIDARQVTVDLLKKHYPKIIRDPHFLGLLNGDQSGKKTKGDICRELGVKVLIEDSLENALGVSSIEIPVILIDTPWNQAQLPDNITRVSGWSEIPDILSLTLTPICFVK